MEMLKRNDLKKGILPGRFVQSAVGSNAAIDSAVMSLGWARFTGEYGPMEPHQHAEESIIVIDAKNGYVRYGSEKDQLCQRISVTSDTVLHFPDQEWHVFEYDEDGYVEILYFYAQSDNIRPEKIKE
jgi:hypothetical protein